MKIVFHAAELARVKIVFNNVRNLLKEIQKNQQQIQHDAECINRQDKPMITVVFNSDAVKALINTPDSQQLDWTALASQAELLVCQNSLNGLDIDKTTLIEPVKIVASGVYHLAYLQTEGFHYIRP